MSATRRWLAAAALLPPLVAGCSGSSGDADGDLAVYVSAPLTAQPWVGRFVERGARLAVEQVNAEGGVETPDGKRRMRLEVLDNGASPQTAVANARTAVAAGAVVLITDGVGAAAVTEVTDPAVLPVFVVFEGGEDIVDPESRPSLFRMAPSDKPMSRRLADYLSEKAERPGLITDDSSYGRNGAEAIRDNLEINEVDLASDDAVSTGASDLAVPVQKARRAGADSLIVWARAPVVAAVVRAARSSGWDVPVYTGPTGEDPLVRQQLADRREWVDGLTFVSFRITSEVGPAPFANYRRAFEERFGVEKVGVQEDGRDVVMPPDWSTYAYDSVRLTAAALARSGGTGGPPLLDALQAVVITGANGDERGFDAVDREGVSPDDMYFARFSGFRFAPVSDDLLSQNLPPVPQ